MSKHTPEPWDDFAFEIYDAEKNIIADCGYSDDVWGKTQCKANAARIVACVNACAGIEDPEATIPALNDLADKAIELTADVNIKEMVINQLKAERDELIRILKVVETAISHDRSYQNTHRAITTILNEIKP